MSQAEKENKKIVKRFQGVVVSNKNDKTISVRVDQVKVSKKYKKRYTVSNKFQVHDEKNLYKEGDKVVFIESRPISKAKKWRVLYN